MDTGTPLDLVNQESVEPHTACITPCKPLILDTANGEARIDRSIDLHVGRLGERIAPYVIDGPNVLSLGRRIVRDGYDWHWLGHTTTPWLVHPTTGEEIVLRVDDDCPYLDDPGTTFPSQYVNDAAVCCSCIRQRIAAPAPTARAVAEDAGGR